MEYEQLITEEGMFSALMAECDTIFSAKQKLPQQVFLKKFKKFYAFSYSQTLKDEFAKFLSTIAADFSDERVNYVTLEPDPVKYYFKHCGFYGLASFKPMKLMDNYTKVMSRGGAADSFRVRGGDIGAFWGSSMEWGIYCDRISWDICLMGVSRDLDKSLTAMLSCMDTATLRKYISNSYRGKDSVVTEFLNRFTSNYLVRG